MTEMPKDPAGRLRFVGVGLWGDAFKKKLAIGLGISRSTLNLWLDGHVPARDIDPDLADLIDRERDAAAARGLDLTALRAAVVASIRERSHAAR